MAGPMKLGSACSTICRRYWTHTSKVFYSSLPEESGIVVEVEEIRNFIQRCMTSVGTRQTHAQALAANLTAADHRGHFSHGLNRLEMYVHDIQSGITASDGEPVIVKSTSATAYVDGCNLLGPVVGNFCMDVAIKKAKDSGVGWVTCKGSNHYGIAGWYAMLASQEGLLGMSFTNTSPLVIPTRARQVVLGTNPLSLAAPGKNGDGVVLDMATSTAALGKIELAAVKKVEIPRGWGADSSGKETHNPQDVLEGGGQLPLGGSEISGGYKGYGLGLLVEIFCGILGGANYGPNIRRWKNTDTVANLGQCFIAVDPNAFAPGFQDRMQNLISICRNQHPAEGEQEVLVPGDPERQHIAKCDEDGGISYHPNLIINLNDLAKQLGVEPIKTV